MEKIDQTSSENKQIENLDIPMDQKVASEILKTFHAMREDFKMMQNDWKRIKLKKCVKITRQ